MLSYSCTLLACLVSSLLPLIADPALGEDRGTLTPQVVMFRGLLPWQQVAIP